jgi:hypothetical protein
MSGESVKKNLVIDRVECCAQIKEENHTAMSMAHGLKQIVLKRQKCSLS